ncbi:uncharacterized protein BJ212DRAFT_1296511 [Suillus subaureus]|uniref:Uncharacterized protein n=1 Tax=Suillus subaureus TaxID=48587 RepID=A0A9P7JHA6_9AGAM|nr:uncharacterized protein BJ212DRAFT_1296511 [Suillus subaureus]KAG1822448.1 hypothetical protein BJ212DRAFT_1296511 [Suillus subaureus]
MAPSSSPPKCSSPLASSSPPTATNGPALQIHKFSMTAPRKTLGNSGCQKHTIPYSLFQGGICDEDSIPPTKKFKTLQTMWNQTSVPSPDVAILVNKCMLKLSHITCWAITTRMWYQHLCSHELDLMKSILGDEQDLAQAHLKVVDVQIGSIRNTLQDVGVGVIGKNGCRFDPGDNGPWCKSSSDDSDSDKPRPAPLVLQAGSHWENLHWLEAYNKPHGFEEVTICATSSKCAVDQIFIISSSFFPHPMNAIDPSHLRVPDTLKAFSTKQAALIGDYLEIQGRLSSYHHIIITIIESHNEGFCTSSPHVTYGGSSRHSDSASVVSTSLTSAAGANSSMDPDRKRFKDFNSNEQVALMWAKRCMILNSAMTTGWLRNITTAEKRAVNDYIVEIINQANLKFGCGKVSNLMHYPYTDEQDAVNEAMLLALSSATHGPVMEAHMLNVHRRGIALHCLMGLEAPTSVISHLPMEEDL